MEARVVWGSGKDSVEKQALRQKERLLLRISFSSPFTFPCLVLHNPDGERQTQGSSHKDPLSPSSIHDASWQTLHPLSLPAPKMHGGGSAPSCFAFAHRVAFEEGSGQSLGKTPRGATPHRPQQQLTPALVPGSPSRTRRPLDGSDSPARPARRRRRSSSAPRRGSAEPRPRGCSGLGEPRPALPSF